MLPEIQSNVSNYFPDFMLSRGSMLSENGVDIERLKECTERIQSDLDPLRIIASDHILCNAIDSIPIEDAISYVIPAVEHAISTANSSELSQVIYGHTRKKNLYSQHRKRVFQQFHERVLDSFPNTAKDILSVLDIPYTIGPQQSQLSTDDMPADIQLVRTFSTRLIIDAFSYMSMFDELQEKLVHVPLVTSVYVDNRSMTYHAVGVRVSSQEIIRSYASDANTGPTIEHIPPDMANADLRTAQVTRWQDVRVLSDVSNAYALNYEGCWYPEFLIIPDQIQSVVVRPYTAWVTRSNQCLGEEEDGNRALAAVLLSKALGVPIEVLE